MDIEELYKKYITCAGVSTDTRAIGKGQFFIALKGERFNGNKYAEIALNKGAKYALVDEPDVVKDERYLLVTNTLDMLQDLSIHHRLRLEIPVIGLTGSNGKTTTKNLLAAVLSKKFRVSATLGNYNNHIGVPLTILNTPLTAEILIVEMGSNQPGDIERLCRIALPDYGLITNVGASHLEKLISIEGVFEEKRHLFDYVSKHQGQFFLNVGDPWLNRLLVDSDQVHTYSKVKGDFGILTAHTNSTEKTISFDLNDGQKQFEIKTWLSGSYNQENIASALAVGKWFEVPTIDMVEAIEAYHPDNMRSEVIQTTRNTLILDAYNANPTSMKASIVSLLENHEPKKIQLIIGDMLELGENSLDFHREMIRFLLSNEIDKAILIGNQFSMVDQDNYPCYPDTESLLKSGVLDSISHQLVLIKGSRGIKLESVIGSL